MRFWHSNATHAIGGMILMGSWAAFANRAHPSPEPLKAALVQATITAVITLIMKRAIEWVARRTRTMIFPALSAGTISAVLLFAIHSLAGTPEVLTTMIVPFLVSTTYGAIYSRSLRRVT